MRTEQKGDTHTVCTHLKHIHPFNITSYKYMTKRGTVTERKKEGDSISFHPVIIFCIGTESQVLCSFSALSSSSLLLPLTSNSKTHCLDVAALQNLITHVKSPLPITSCVTPVDHIMFLFLLLLWPPSVYYTINPTLIFILPKFLPPYTIHSQTPFPEHSVCSHTSDPTF